MTTGNKKLHQYIITNFPEILHSYEEYNSSNPFGVFSTGNSSDLQLLSPITQDTLNGEARIILFGLGDSIAVNSIIGIPKL